MNPLVAKEVRLLLPAYVMALFVVIVTPWLLPLPPEVTFGFAAVVLALSPFGREFGLRTFPMMLAQPVERRRIWWTKIVVLAGAMIVLLGVWGLSYAARVYLGIIWRFFPVWGFPVWREVLMIAATIAVVSMAGALWTTLLLRQAVASFWFTILVPAVILMVISTHQGTEAATYAAMGIYSVMGFWLAWWQFSRVQEAGWTGGVITLPGWRRTDAAARPVLRSRRPRMALLKKEFQLHQVGLTGMAGLFIVHLGVVWLRKTSHTGISETTRTALEVFGGLWYLVPLLIGCSSVAEERKLGTINELLCLPVSSRVQFYIKLLFTLVLGGLLGALLLWTAEGIGEMIGASPGLGGFKDPFNPYVLIRYALGFSALALIGFYASTLTRGVVPALAAAVVAVMGVSAVYALADVRWTVFGIPLWRGLLVYYIAAPALTATFVWLAGRNFKSMSENWFFWRRNLLGFAAALVFITAATTAVYNRAWELLTPLEPAHGPARLAGPKPAGLHVYYGGDMMAALLPNGRLWVGRIGYDQGRALLRIHRETGGGNGEDDALFAGGKWHGFQGNHFVAGSNWVDAVNARQTVAIRADGTLWVSKAPLYRHDWTNAATMENADVMVRFGDGTDWQNVVVGYDSSIILLKGDGSLWRWVDQFNKEKPPELRAAGPHRLGVDSDWAKILPNPVFSYTYAWKRDGQAWLIHQPEMGIRKHAGTELEPGEPGGLVMVRLPALDNTKWRSIVECLNRQVGLRGDGTLWLWHTSRRLDSTRGETWKITLGQIGTNTNWVAIAGGYSWASVTAMKADGSLWRWSLEDENSPAAEEKAFSSTPTRLGSHSDWIAIGNSMGGLVSLAADGSLWYWWDRNVWETSILPLPGRSRRPSEIENILAREK